MHDRKHYIRMEDVNTDWYNALPLGNGRMGAMVYRKENQLYAALNHYDVYYAMLPEYQEQKPMDTKRSRQLMEQVLEQPMDSRSHYTETRSPRPANQRPIYGGTTQPYGGEVIVKVQGMVEESLLELIIEDAVVQWSGIADGKAFQFDIWIPKDEDRVIIQKGDGDSVIAEVEYVLTIQDMDPAPERSTAIIAKDCGVVKAWGKGLCYEAMLYCQKGECCEIQRDRIRIYGNAIDRISVSLRQEAASYEMHKSLPKSYGKGWESFWNHARIQLPDINLETLWYLQMYLLEASSGRGGRYSEQACGLNGLWDIRRPSLWGSMWYWDVNIQSAFASVFITDQMELAKDFCQAYLHYGDRAKEFAKSLYGIDGWALDYPHAFYNCIQPWCVQFLYRYYEYTQDATYLKEQLHPVMESMFAFIRKRVVIRKDGTIAVEPDISPEQGPMTVNSVITISTLRYFLEKYIIVLKKLRKNMEQPQKLLKKIPEYPKTMDMSRYRDSEGAPDDLWLRHPSILMPIYPGEEIHANTEKDEKQRWMETLRYVQEHTEIGVFGFPWIAAAMARMGEGAAALRVLYEKGIDAVIHTNGMAYEETDRWVNYCGVTKPPLFMPGMMEPTGGIAVAVCEMLLQVRDNVIHVFPAIPNGKDTLQLRTGYLEEEVDQYQEPAIWKDVSFQGLRTPNGCLVSAVMKEGSVTGVEVTALRDGCCKLAMNGRIHEWLMKKGTVYRFGEMEKEAVRECRQVLCHEAGHTHRRVYIGENRHTQFHKILDAWQCAYGMGNHLQMSHMVPYKWDFGDVTIGKDYDTVSHRQVSISEWASLYYGGWIRLNGTEIPTKAYGFSQKGKLQVIQREGPDALRSDFITGTEKAVFDIRVPGGKYELLVISGDEDAPTTGRFTILNNGLSQSVKMKKGQYAMEELPVIMKEEGVIQLLVESLDAQGWKLNGLLLRKERALL